MSRKTRSALTLAALALTLGSVAAWAANKVNVTTNDAQRCVTSNGLPDHATGHFPNKGNPHSIKAQNISVCLPLNPKRGDHATEVNTTGIATNGILIRPSTADYYDASSPRGHSRSPKSGWNLEGMGAGDMLGLDDQNAHVDVRGIYHYHGVPSALAKTGNDTLIGWAADGFEIHYVGASARPSYMLLPGARATAPGGTHDGTYVEDWTHVQGAGNLDQCNGGMSGGSYVYFATDTYPFFPRCLYGTKITRIR